MLAEIKEANDSEKIGCNTVVGSLDVKALYPSLDLDFTIDKVAEEFYESEVKIEGVDYEEMGLYLSLNRDERYLRERNILDHCPRRKSKYGAPPKITGSGINVSKEARFKAWLKPEHPPDPEKQRIMLKESLKIVLTTLMKNHIYDFKKEMRLQKEGGAIGMDITGELAKVFMTWWDKKMIQKLSEENIHPVLYKRYVDDINIAVDKVNEETRNEKYIEIRQERNDQENIEADRRTFEEIQRIGNEIHESIQLTYDVPSNNEDRKVPILDLKCWIEEVQVAENKEYRILHEHYIKEVSSKSVIHREAALSLSSKRTILTQECLRILLNCHELIGQEKIAQHLTRFMARMQAAGYDKSFRMQVLKSGYHAYDTKKEEETRGRTPLYKKRNWRRDERRKEREEKKKNWFKKGEKESVLFITATPDSQLRNLMQREIEKTPFKIRVIEKSGTKLVRLLQKNDPFKKDGCRDSEGCMVCSGSSRKTCRETGVTYRINCLGEHANDPEKTCDGVYKGETGKNGYTRGKGHMDDFRNKRETSAMWKHCILKHNSNEQQFEMVVEDRVRNDPMKRQILEAIRIQSTPDENLMNSRSEWNMNPVPRIIINTE